MDQGHIVDEHVVYSHYRELPEGARFADFCRNLWPPLMAELFARNRIRVLFPVALVLETTVAALMAAAGSWVSFGVLIVALCFQVMLVVAAGPVTYLKLRRMAKRGVVVEAWFAAGWFAMRGEGYQQINDRRISYAAIEYLKEYSSVTAIRIIGCRQPLVLDRRQLAADAYRLLYSGTIPMHRRPSRARQRALMTPPRN